MKRGCKNVLILGALLSIFTVINLKITFMNTEENPIIHGGGRVYDLYQDVSSGKVKGLNTDLHVYLVEEHHAGMYILVIEIKSSLFSHGF